MAATSVEAMMEKVNLGIGFTDVGATQLTNNQCNEWEMYRRTRVLGRLSGSLVIESSSGGIYTLSASLHREAVTSTL